MENQERRLSRIAEIFKENEPHLSDVEKEDMWKEIRSRHRRRKLGLWAAVASSAAAVILIAGFFIFSHNDISSDEEIIAVVRNSDDGHVMLKAGKQQFSLERECKILCSPKRNLINITQNSTNFSIYFPDGERLAIYVPEMGKAEVILEDGSAITLREKSSMIFPYSVSDAKERNVFLEGEAFMDVFHDESKPFVAKSRNLTVSVLGTKFLFSAFPEMHKENVTLLEGSVAVKSAAVNQWKKIQPDQMYSYSETDNMEEIISNVNTKSLLSWKNEVLTLNNEPLTLLLYKAIKCYGVDIIFDPARTDKIILTGKFDASVPIDEFLKRLQILAPISVERKGTDYAIR